MADALRDLIVVCSHALGVVQAKARLERTFAQMAFSGDYHLNWTWIDYQAVLSIKMYEVTIQGTVSVSGTEVELQSRLPLVALPFRSQIEEEIKTKIRNGLDTP